MSGKTTFINGVSPDLTKHYKAPLLLPLHDWSFASPARWSSTADDGPQQELLNCNNYKGIFVSPSSSSWANCFLGSFWSACSLHNGGIWKVIIHSRLKNGTHFPCFESLSKGYFICSKWVYASLSHEILRQTMFGDKVLWYTQISVIITTIFSDKYQLNTFFGQFSVNYYFWLALNFYFPTGIIIPS